MTIPPSVFAGLSQRFSAEDEYIFEILSARNLKDFTELKNKLLKLTKPLNTMDYCKQKLIFVNKKRQKKV